MVTWSDKELFYLESKYERTNMSAYMIWLRMQEFNAGGDVEFNERTKKAIEKKIEALGLMKPQRYVNGHEVVMAYVDIETSHFDADMGIMLSWAIKIRDGPVAADVISKADLDAGLEDTRILRSLSEAVQGIDTYVTYYGTGFDLKFMRTRHAMEGIYFPGWGEKRHIDVYYQIRRNFKLSRNSLDNACKTFGIVGKNHFDKKIWRLAARGDDESLQYIVHHNVLDVQILERLHKEVERYTMGNSRRV